MKKAHEERNKEMIRLYEEECLTQVEIAKRFGMTRQRASQIIGTHKKIETKCLNCGKKITRKPRQTKNRKKCDECAAKENNLICPHCSGRKNKESSRCGKCVKEGIGYQFDIDPDLFKKLYMEENLTHREISEKFNLPIHRVINIILRLGLYNKTDYRSKKKRKYDHDEIFEMMDEGKTLNEISEEIGISRNYLKMLYYRHKEIS